MQRNLNHLNRRIVPRLDGKVCRQRQVRQTESSWVRIPARADNLEDGCDGEGEVLRVVAQVHVDVEEGRWVAGVPAGDDAEGAAANGPFGAVLADGETSTWD